MVDVSRAQQAQRHERRFSRALTSLSSPWRALYQHIVVCALQAWGDARITLALDTTLLFKRWCVICESMVYRGRALPLAWRVLRHASSMVKTDEIHPVLASVPCLLMHIPHLEEICITADRGFFDTALMADLSAYGWHWTLRGKAQVYLFDAAGQALGQFRTLLSQHGQMVVRHDVYVTAQRYGPVSIAAVLPVGAQAPWFIVSDEPCSARSVAEYHERMQIEEGFLDLKSAAWHLEDTRLTELGQFERLRCVLGLATLITLSEGAAVVASGQRRQFDRHWVRALSDVQIGWRAIRRRLTDRVPLLERLRLSPAPDPEPSRRRRSPLRLNVVRGFS